MNASTQKQMTTNNAFSVLASIKNKLPIKEMVRKPTDEERYELLADYHHNFGSFLDIKVGTRIVRPVLFFTTGRKRILSPTFQTNARGSIIVRPFDTWCPESPFFSTRLVASNKNEGMVCFCNAKLPDNWIYFTVNEISAKKNYCVVSYKKGTDEELFNLYKFPSL